METTVGTVVFLMSVVSEAFTALLLVYIAHYDVRLSRQEIRIPAMVGTVVGALVAVEYFGKKLRKPN